MTVVAISRRIDHPQEEQEQCHLCELDGTHTAATVYAFDGNYYCGYCAPIDGDLVMCSECHEWAWDGNHTQKGERVVCFGCS